MHWRWIKLSKIQSGCFSFLRSPCLSLLFDYVSFLRSPAGAQLHTGRSIEAHVVQDSSHGFGFSGHFQGQVPILAAGR